MRQGNAIGRCCSYPQGQISFLPQIIATAAVICAFYALPWTPGSWFPTVDFMCIQVNRNARSLGEDYDTSYTSESSYSSLSLSHECKPLQLVDESYWSGNSDDSTEWAMQMGTVFAILNAIAGSVSTLLLFSGICFHLDKTKTLGIAITYFVCASFSLLTLIVGATDLCKIYGDDSCERHRVRLEKGAVAEVFACIFFICAGLLMIRFYVLVRSNKIPEEEATETIDEELAPLHKHQPTAPIPTPVTRSLPANVPANV